MPMLALMSVLTGSLTVGLCSTATQPDIGLSLRTAPARVATDYDRSSISDLAKVTGNTVDPNPVGFFTETLKYQVKLRERPPEQPTCAASFKIELIVSLESRLIEVARDLPNRTCSLRVATAHFARIMEADRSAVEMASKVVLQSLKEKLHTMTEPVSAKQYRELAIETAREAVSQNAEHTTMARLQAQANARDREDINAIVAACGRGL